ncbi:unnamed protein product [Blepharisma stoltei]|uniref:Uncharacterized protein n=1 Tax=Blepharisma stoltei TaxID=1481888 RepID=A0AAU9K0S5_9CILI|nr:unnamed protein product [Blepharisma stoltei]
MLSKIIKLTGRFSTQGKLPPRYNEAPLRRQRIPQRSPQKIPSSKNFGNSQEYSQHSESLSSASLRGPMRFDHYSDVTLLNLQSEIRILLNSSHKLLSIANSIHQAKSDKGYDYEGSTTNRMFRWSEFLYETKASTDDIAKLIKIIEDKELNMKQIRKEEAKSALPKASPQVEKKSIQSDSQPEITVEKPKKMETSKQNEENLSKESGIEEESHKEGKASEQIEKTVSTESGDENDSANINELYKSCYSTMQNRMSKSMLVEKLKTIDTSAFGDLTESQSSTICLALLQCYSEETKDVIAKALTYLDTSFAKSLKDYKNSKEIELFLQNRLKIYKDCDIPIANKLQSALSEFMTQSCDPINEITLINIIMHLLHPIKNQTSFIADLTQLVNKIKLVDLQTSFSEVLDNILDTFTSALEMVKNKDAQLEIAEKRELFESIMDILAVRFIKGDLAFDLTSKYINAFTPTKNKENLLKILTNPDHLALKSIENKSILPLLKTGLQTYSDDYKKLCEYVLKPIYEIFFTRLSNIKNQMMVEILESLMKTCYYLENKVDDACRLILADLTRGRKENKLEAFYSILKFIWDSTGQVDKENFEKLADLIFKFSGDEAESMLINVATLLSQVDLDLDDFWQEFFKEVEITYKHEEKYYKSLYQILLNLNGTPKYDTYRHTLEPYASIMETNYKEDVEKAYRQHQKPRAYEFLNNLLKERKIEYQENFYDGFYFDFAIPSQKIAISLMSYENYVFPELQIKQSSLAPTRYLESKGWKVCNVPYFALNSSKLAGAVESVLDFNKPDNTNNQ